VRRPRRVELQRQLRSVGEREIAQRQRHAAELELHRAGGDLVGDLDDKVLQRDFANSHVRSRRRRAGGRRGPRRSSRSGRRGRGSRRHQGEQVDGAVLLPTGPDRAARERHRGDARLRRHRIGGDARDGERGDFQRHRAAGPLEDLESAHLHRAVGELQHALARGEVDVVSTLQGQRAARDLGLHVRGKIRGVLGEHDVLDAERALRTDRVGPELAGPGELLAGLGHRLEVMRRALIAHGAEIREPERHRSHGRRERTSGRSVGKLHAGARYVEAADVHGPRGLRGGGGRGRSGGRGGGIPAFEPAQDVGDIERAVRLHRDPGVETVEVDVAHGPRLPQRGPHVGVHVQPLPTQERRGAVRLANGEVFERGRHRVGVEPHLFDGHLPAEFGGQSLLELAPDDRRGDEKPDDRVEGDQAGEQDQATPELGHGWHERSVVRGRGHRNPAAGRGRMGPLTPDEFRRGRGRLRPDAPSSVRGGRAARSTAPGR